MCIIKQKAGKQTVNGGQYDEKDVFLYFSILLYCVFVRTVCFLHSFFDLLI